MGDLPLEVIEGGARSALCVSDDGSLYRVYHDTGVQHGPIYPAIDVHGVSRHSHNRRVSTLIDSVRDTAYRGTRDGEKPVHAGKNKYARPQPHEHLRRALRVLSHQPRDIHEFAQACDVKTSTAWSYACKVVEHWPGARAAASRLVYPPLLELCKDTSRMRGSLKEVMNSIRKDMEGDMEWRCLEDRYAHLRLARLCAESRRKRSSPHEAMQKRSS